MLQHLDTVIAFVVILLGVSLLITVLTQMGSALLGLRGTNLRWGLVQLLRTVHPEFAQHADRIAERVLKHPVISDSSFSRWRLPVLSRWRLASSIRVEELVGILERLSAGTTPLPPGAVAPAGATLEQAMATIASRGRLEAEQRVQEVAAQVGQFLSGAVPKAAAVAVGAPGAAISAGIFQPSVKLEELMEKLPALTHRPFDSLHSWFDAVMARTAQRFALHMRLWTVGFALITAFALHLDSLQLLKRLSADAEMRAGLVASAASISAAAERITSGPAPGTTVEELAKEAGALRGEVEKSGLQLVPNPYPGWDYGTPATLFNHHFWGVLITAALLSLGAPFWFNMLKTLSSLRPVLAEREKPVSERS